MNPFKQPLSALMLLPVLLLALGSSVSHATEQPGQSQACVEQAKSNNELNQCGGPILKLFEDRIEGEYKRLHDKFTGNEKMQEVLKASRESWERYRANQCALEASAVSGTYVVKPFSLEANKVYFKCMARTFGEMKSSLEKF